jgi:hypothetical protein
VTDGPPLGLACGPVMGNRFGAITVANSRMTATAVPITERRSRVSVRRFGREGGGAGARAGDSYGLATGSFGSDFEGVPPSGCPHRSQKSESAGIVAPQLLQDFSGNILTSFFLTNLLFPYVQQFGNALRSFTFPTLRPDDETGQ